MLYSLKKKGFDSMFQIQCNIVHINYESAIDFALQKITPNADPALRPLLESVSHCKNDIINAFTSSVSEKEIQNALIYMINANRDKIKKAIEEVFLKKEFTIHIASIDVSAVENTLEYFVHITFKIVSCNNKFLTPFLSDKLWAKVFRITPVTNQLLFFVENILKKQIDFIEIKNLSIAVI